MKRVIENNYFQSFFFISISYDNFPQTFHSGEVVRTKFYSLSQLKFLIKFFLQFLVPAEHISTLNSTLVENFPEWV